ncbi:MAG: cell division protein ZapA [Vannielia sp.]|uniref:cell division protein ZapA n=1 Tax=Rhodobacterales TaxID=204455 RepID=UPI00209560C1|nr:cell division protein ZapA [Oceanicola sp. 502str15]MCO6382511.1 cell division protein ZapA [Oceanicola sp. 502str15]
MAEVEITIGGRNFQVACQEGEEHYLTGAAVMLDREASALVSQIGRLPEARMLLMAGLMLADRTAAFEEKAAAAEQRVAELERQVAALEAAPKPEPARVEVPVVPREVEEFMAELAARAESLAAQAEEKAG